MKITEKVNVPDYLVDRVNTAFQSHLDKLERDLGVDIGRHGPYADTLEEFYWFIAGTAMAADQLGLFDYHA
ncbi:MAG: hypothetical protein ACLQIB_16465 [Isosphaeraceae bacterium]|jgi:hypothetical protein